MTGLTEARCEALFASGLQPSDAPTAGMVAAAITRTVREFGSGGCAGRMAQEFGDHPDAAAWPQAGPGARPGGHDAASGPVAA